MQVHVFALPCELQPCAKAVKAANCHFTATCPPKRRPGHSRHRVWKRADVFWRLYVHWVHTNARARAHLAYMRVSGRVGSCLGVKMCPEQGIMIIHLGPLLYSLSFGGAMRES